MRKSGFIVLLILFVLLCSCTTNSNELHNTNSNSSPINEQNSTVFSQASSNASENFVSLTIDEMIEISLELYENGYLTFMRFARDMEDEKTMPGFIEIEGKEYSRVENYDTRTELETALSESFTDEFIKRNTDDYFNTDNWHHVFEHNEQLFYNEVGGTGGTFLLYTEDIEITDATDDSWNFVLYGIDTNTNEKSTHKYTFTVKNEGGQYLIDSYESVFSDGSGYENR